MFQPFSTVTNHKLSVEYIHAMANKEIFKLIHKA